MIIAFAIVIIFIVNKDLMLELSIGLQLSNLHEDHYEINQ